MSLIEQLKQRFTGGHQPLTYEQSVAKTFFGDALLYATNALNEAKRTGDHKQRVYWKNVVRMHSKALKERGLSPRQVINERLQATGEHFWDVGHRQRSRMPRR